MDPTPLGEDEGMSYPGHEALFSQLNSLLLHLLKMPKTPEW